METKVEKEALKHLSRIEGELEAIKESAPTSKSSFIHGIWQGAGAVAGGLLAVLLLGWILSIFGLIPGFGSIANYLQNAVHEWRGR